MATRAKNKETSRTTPSQRLAAQMPKPRKRADKGAAAAAVVSDVTIDDGEAVRGMSASLQIRPTLEKVRFKWIVKHKGEVPAVAGDQIVTHYLVQLEAAYEPLSILDGQANVQGNIDNRAFGLGVPKAELSLVLASKAIADTFRVGRAYHSDFTPVEQAVHGLY